MLSRSYLYFHYYLQLYRHKDSPRFPRDILRFSRFLQSLCFPLHRSIHSTVRKASLPPRYEFVPVPLVLASISLAVSSDAF